MQIYIVRHGETDYNKRRILQGRTDIPLNEDGVRQAREAAKQLGEPSFDRVYTSPLKRAVATAQILSGCSEEELIMEERLKEMSFGVMEGHALAELPPQVLALFATPEDFVPAEGGESIAQLKERCQAFLDDRKEEWKELPEDAKVLVVSHGATIHGIIGCITGSDTADFWRPKVGNCTAIRAVLSHGKIVLENGLELEDRPRAGGTAADVQASW